MHRKAAERSSIYMRVLYPVYTIKLARRAGYMLAGRASSMFARCLLDACWMSARRLLPVCLMSAQSCRRGITLPAT